MKMLSQKIVFFIGLLMLFGQQTAFADVRPHSQRQAPVKHWKTSPSPHNPRVEPRFNRHHEAPAQAPSSSYRHYYTPGHRVQPLPYGSSRIFVNAAEYFFFDGYFYQPSLSGYVIVAAPIGAIVASLPRLHHVLHWRGQPYYVVGNTFYRRHPRGYIVVPNPGFDYWR